MFGLPGTSWVPTNSTNCLCEIALILMFELSLVKFEFVAGLKIGSKPSGRLLIVSRW